MSKSLIIVLAIVAVVLLLLGGLVEAVKFLLYVGLVVLVIAVVLWIVGRIRSKA